MSFPKNNKLNHIIGTMIQNVRQRCWVSCPLGMNHLLSLVKGSKSDSEKYNQASWKASSDGACMKVYNSFNYTQDLKYEARLLELPLQDNLKFVIIVPNEIDVIHSLFHKLTNQGFAAALKSIQPVFIAVSKINAPSMKIDIIFKKIDKMENLLLAQYGNLDVNEDEIKIEVLSSIFPAHNESILECFQASVSPFFFGLLHEDMPIFTGQYFNPDPLNPHLPTVMLF